MDVDLLCGCGACEKDAWWCREFCRERGSGSGRPPGVASARGGVDEVETSLISCLMRLESDE